jgi:S1-C subfamily serine protease
VTPESAAAEAGLEAGDILLTYDGEDIEDMQSYSNFLRQSSPGDMVEISVNRQGQEVLVEATLKAR